MNALPRRLRRSRSLLGVALAIATVATAGSLSLSLVLGLVPCDLCWYQRILMYPLVVVFGVALVEDRPAIYRTTLPLSAGGALVAAYHSWLQLSASAFCSFGGGCATVQLRVAGLTIPNLSLLAFLLLTLAGLGLWRRADASD